jgi:tetrathionate reductase subunit A
MRLDRRDFLKLSALVGATTLSGFGFSNFLYAQSPPTFIPMKNGGRELEAKIDPFTGELVLNENIFMRHSSCLGCYSSCGNRVKLNKKTGQMLSVSGNPFSPSSTQPHLSLNSPLKDAYYATGQYKNLGLTHRATLCARGQGTLETHYDPYRILTPLKRAGKRGSGKWKPISWQEAVQETVHGGALFKELGESREIEGLQQIRDTKTLLDSNQPEFGSKANQLALLGGRGDGRTHFAARFASAYGTVNMFTHGSS